LKTPRVARTISVPMPMRKKPNAVNPALMRRNVRMIPSTRTATEIVRMARGFARLGRIGGGRGAREVWSRLDSTSLPPHSPQELLPSREKLPHETQRSKGTLVK